MKKLFTISLILALIFTYSVAFAGSWKDLFIKKGALTKEAETTVDFNTVLGSLPLNLNGDTVFLTRDKTWNVGVGIDLATYKNIINLRAETAAPASGSSDIFAGVGVLLNIPALFTLAGIEWNASYINPSIGVVPGYNFGLDKYDTGIVLSIIQVTF